MNLEEVELFRRWKLKNIFAKLSPHFFPIRQIISEKAKLAMRNLLLNFCFCKFAELNKKVQIKHVNVNKIGF